MKQIFALGLTLISGILLLADSFAQNDDAQQRPSGVPSVYQYGFMISYADRSMRIGSMVIRPAQRATAGDADGEGDSGLYLLILNEAGQPEEAVFSMDFTELLRTLPDRMVIGLSIQSPGSGFSDQFFYGRLKADLSGLTIGDFSADVVMNPADVRFPPLADAQAATGQSLFKMGRVAHAGGGLQGVTYTNSYEALDSNLDKGFEYFEIDFVFTSDGHLVCLHDWDVNFTRTFGFETASRLSLQEFLALVEANDRFTNCTLEGLADWMSTHPAAYLITDVKDDNIAALEQIINTVPDAQHRVIPQIYYPQEYAAAKAIGFEQIIWTLYKIGASDLEVLNQLAAWEGPVAVTMPRQWAESGLAMLLQARGIPSYAHTVNSEEELQRLVRELGISEIYTDFLDPEQFSLGSSQSP